MIQETEVYMDKPSPSEVKKQPYPAGLSHYSTISLPEKI